MDFGLERTKLSIQHADLEDELREALRTVETIRDQIAALDLHDEELRASEDEQGHSDGEEWETNYSSAGEIPQLEPSEPEYECTVCMTSYPMLETVMLSCTDIWCKECIVRIFEEATTNEGVWPPKCCRVDIPITSVFHFLSTEIRNNFFEKSAEWSVKDRTYCFLPQCSTFIEPYRIIGRYARCVRCGHKTCAECKECYHTNMPCPKLDADNAMARQVATANGWKQCPSCKRLVELSYGCNHMTYVLRHIKFSLC